jgi:hypothetical protein
MIRCLVFTDKKIKFFVSVSRVSAPDHNHDTKPGPRSQGPDFTLVPQIHLFVFDPVLPCKTTIASINSKVVPGKNKKMHKGNRLLHPWYEVHNPGLKMKINGGDSLGCLLKGE